jgi:hypothetical protein
MVGYPKNAGEVRREREAIDRDRKKLHYLPPNMLDFVYESDDILPEEENERCN